MNTDEVLCFINGFKTKYKSEIEYVFSAGYCYWFAFILKERFDGIIYYLPIENHFITYINGYYFDIKGVYDISNTKIYLWDDYESVDNLDYGRVVKYCIYKKE